MVERVLREDGEPWSEEAHQRFMAYRNERLAIAYRQACAWFDAVRDAGIPLVGQWEWMEPAKYTSPEDAYCSFFVEASCKEDCEFHTLATPARYRKTLFAYQSEYSSARYMIQRAKKPRYYSFTETGPKGSFSAKGYSPWLADVDVINLDDVVEKTRWSFAPFACKHLLPMLGESLLVDALYPLQLLENPTL